MNNPNPFVPKGSLLEQQSKRRSHLRLAVLCVSVVGTVSLIGMLIQGCKREQNNETENQPPADTNTVVADTNQPSMVASNNPPVAPPPVAVQPPAPPAGTEYVVVHGDTLGKIAKKNGVTLSALKEANPGVEPTKLKVGQKLTIPGGGTAPAAGGASAAPDTGVGGETYTVKSGDSLTKIAK
jgi:LysM repeat protein